MRGLNFILSLVFSVFGLCAYLAFDYAMVARQAKARGEEPMSVVTYASGLLQLAGALSGNDGDPARSDAPQTLVAMLPAPPEGWTVRPAEPADVEAFLPPGARGKQADRVRAIGVPREGKGLTGARVIYEKGPRKVVAEVIRYPDFIFTSFMAMAQKFELQMLTAEYGGRDFATVRGLEIREAPLPEDFGARLFVAEVGAQIHLRMLASKAMSDEDLLPFLSTLNVPAMNANVVERTTGLGEVPVIVLASVLDAETRKTFEAERDAERQRRAEEQAAREAELEAERKAAEDAERGLTTDEKTGVKVRKGTGSGDGSRFETSGGTLDDSDCVAIAGGKTCGAPPPPGDD
ncbi:hypothetical protein [Fuscovulum blasticum]|uniref:hypothetical protein n=1 Tax=Fuscovulum blasticum TaxID=1075 RepID=UPI000D3E10E4|nr:hypothetical protein [Fuscovulum blasticum]AWD21526.1 hypothetical protein B6K69_07430 [Fuscovulum blasticum]